MSASLAQDIPAPSHAERVKDVEREIVTQEGYYHVNHIYYASPIDAARQRAWEAERRVREADRGRLDRSAADFQAYVDQNAQSYQRRLPWVIGAIRSELDAQGAPHSVTHELDLRPSLAQQETP